MVNYSNPMLMALRRAGQSLGVLRPALRLWRTVSGHEYEDKFGERMIADIKVGSVVWDVGANVGFFTERFSSAVGKAGKVVAWEPSPSCFAVLQRKFQSTTNVTMVQKGLANQSGEVDFSLTESLDPTGGIGIRGDHRHSFRIDVTTGDDFVVDNPELTPNYVKIDVEGYECEVLDGMSRTLANPTMKGVYLEVHFQQLADRGMSQAPANIVSLLKKLDFSTSWTDPSHLLAERP